MAFELSWWMRDLHRSPFSIGHSVPVFGGSSRKDTIMEKSGFKPASKPTVAPTQGDKGKSAEGQQHRSGASADKNDKGSNTQHEQKK